MVSPVAYMLTRKEKTMVSLAVVMVASCTFGTLPAPSAEAIAKQIATRAAQDVASGVNVRLRKEYRREEVVGPKKLRPSESKVWLFEGNGIWFHQTLVRRDDSPVYHETPELKNTDPRKIFLARYLLVPEPCSTAVEGRQHWVVNFTPRTDIDLPSEGEEDDSLNRTFGLLYVDVLSGFVRRASGSMDTPYRVDIVGRVKETDIKLEQQEINGIVVLSSITTTTRYTAFGQPHKRTDSYTVKPLLPGQAP